MYVCCTCIGEDVLQLGVFMLMLLFIGKARSPAATWGRVSCGEEENFLSMGH